MTSVSLSCIRLEISARRSQFALHVNQRRVFDLMCIECGGFVSFQFSQPSMTQHFSLAAMRQVENTIVKFVFCEMKVLPLPV